MSILYRKEHSLCKEYASPGQSIFEVYRFRKGEELPSKIMDYTAIVFVLEGQILSNCGSFLNCVINSSCILLIPSGMKISGVALEDSLLLRCIFNIEGHLCNRYSFESLTEFIDLDTWKYKFDVLPICERLSEFVSLLIRCLDDGLGCIHFHRSKCEELMLMFRGYYTKEDLARFFYPVLSANWDINSFVLNHYKKANDVNELADMAHLSLVTFNRHFKKAFGETAARWLEKRRAEDLLREIQLTRKTFAEIALEFRFSSPAYLTTFCKRHFGKTPKQLRTDFLSGKMPPDV